MGGSFGGMMARVAAQHGFVSGHNEIPAVEKKPQRKYKKLWKAIQELDAELSKLRYRYDKAKGAEYMKFRAAVLNEPLLKKYRLRTIRQCLEISAKGEI